eukprot:gene17496-24223_t
MWLLGDFGSSKRINKKVKTTNLASYVKIQIKTAQPQYDWFMLLMVLLKESLPQKNKWMKIFCVEDDKYDISRIGPYIEDIALDADERLKVLFKDLLHRTKGLDVFEKEGKMLAKVITDEIVE